MRAPHRTHAIQIPSVPRLTAIALVTQSCVTVGSTSARCSRPNAIGSSHSPKGCQTPATCNQPPTIASTVRTPTGTIIVHGPSLWPGPWSCSFTSGEGSPRKTRKKRRKV